MASIGPYAGNSRCIEASVRGASNVYIRKETGPRVFKHVDTSRPGRISTTVFRAVPVVTQGIPFGWWIGTRTPDRELET
jgi:hypothetical protein